MRVWLGIYTFYVKKFTQFNLMLNNTMRKRLLERSNILYQYNQGVKKKLKIISILCILVLCIIILTRHHLTRTIIYHFRTSRTIKAIIQWLSYRYLYGFVYETSLLFFLIQIEYLHKYDIVYIINISNYMYLYYNNIWCLLSQMVLFTKYTELNKQLQYLLLFTYSQIIIINRF